MADRNPREPIWRYPFRRESKPEAHPADNEAESSASVPLRPSQHRSRLGFMKGQFTVPDDFDTMFAEEIEQMFYGGDIEPLQETEKNRSAENNAADS